MQYLAFMLIGVLGGLIGGSFGVGGGILVVPILVMALGFTQHMAQGTMIATFILPSFLFAAWTYYKAGHINVPAALFISMGMMLGTFLGARYVQAVSAPNLKTAFGIFIILVGLKLVFWK